MIDVKLQSLLRPINNCNSKPTSITKTSLNVEIIVQGIQDSAEWAEVVDLFRSGRFNLPKLITETYGNAFLLKGSEYKNKE